MSLVHTVQTCCCAAALVVTDAAMVMLLVVPVQELQQAGHEASAAALVLQQLQQELQDVSQQQQQLQTQQEICMSGHSSTSKKLREVAQQLQQLDARLVGQTADITGLAESVLGCLEAARAHAATPAAPAAPMPNSYLSNLLGPAVPPAAAVAPVSKQLQWGAWVSKASGSEGWMLTVS